MGLAARRAFRAQRLPVTLLGFTFAGLCRSGDEAAGRTLKGNLDLVAVKNSVRTLGFVLLPGLLDRAEVLHMREALQHWRVSHPEASTPEVFPEASEGTTPVSIADALSHEELRQMFKPLLENAALKVVLKAYHGSSYQELNCSDVGINRGVAWHKDILAKPYDTFQKTSVWQPTQDGAKYGITKVALYLQDHNGSNPAALSVVPGSHTQKDLCGRGRHPCSGHIALHPSLGDVMIFDQRITHRSGSSFADPALDVDRLLFSYSVSIRNIFAEEFEQGSMARQNKQKYAAQNGYKQNARALVQPKWLRRCEADTYCCDGGHGQGRPHRLLPSSHELTWIADRYRAMTDKVLTSSTGMKHSYTEFYGPFFEASRQTVRFVLEAGILAGGSLLMWRDFFPKAEVWGIDLRTARARGTAAENWDMSRIKLVQGDVFDVARKNRLRNVSMNGGFDIIVDDASEDREHQLQFLNTYRYFLRPGGWLIIEDVRSQQDAEFITDSFRGDRNRLSVIDRTFALPSYCDERLIVYSASGREPPEQ